MLGLTSTIYTICILLLWKEAQITQETPEDKPRLKSVGKVWSHCVLPELYSPCEPQPFLLSAFPLCCNPPKAFTSLRRNSCIWVSSALQPCLEGTVPGKKSPGLSSPEDRRDGGGWQPKWNQWVKGDFPALCFLAGPFSTFLFQLLLKSIINEILVNWKPFILRCASLFHIVLSGLLAKVQFR